MAAIMDDFTWFYPADPQSEKALVGYRKNKKMPFSECVWYDMPNPMKRAPGQLNFNPNAHRGILEDKLRRSLQPAAPPPPKAPATQAPRGPPPPIQIPPALQRSTTPVNQTGSATPSINAQHYRYPPLHPDNLPPAPTSAPANRGTTTNAYTHKSGPHQQQFSPSVAPFNTPATAPRSPLPGQSTYNNLNVPYQQQRSPLGIPATPAQNHHNQNAVYQHQRSPQGVSSTPVLSSNQNARQPPTSPHGASGMPASNNAKNFYTPAPNGMEKYNWYQTQNTLAPPDGRPNSPNLQRPTTPTYNAQTAPKATPYSSSNEKARAAAGLPSTSYQSTPYQRPHTPTYNTLNPPAPSQTASPPSASYQSVGSQLKRQRAEEDARYSPGKRRDSVAPDSESGKSETQYNKSPQTGSPAANRQAQYTKSPQTGSVTHSAQYAATCPKVGPSSPLSKAIYERPHVPDFFSPQQVQNSDRTEPAAKKTRVTEAKEELKGLGIEQPETTNQTSESKKPDNTPDNDRAMSWVKRSF